MITSFKTNTCSVSGSKPVQEDALQFHIQYLLVVGCQRKTRIWALGDLRKIEQGTLGLGLSSDTARYPSELFWMGSNTYSVERRDN